MESISWMKILQMWKIQSSSHHPLLVLHLNWRKAPRQSNLCTFHRRIVMMMKRSNNQISNVKIIKHKINKHRIKAKLMMEIKNLSMIFNTKKKINTYKKDSRSLNKLKKIDFISQVLFFSPSLLFIITNDYVNLVILNLSNINFIYKVSLMYFFIQEFDSRFNEMINYC